MGASRIHRACIQNIQVDRPHPDINRSLSYMIRILYRFILPRYGLNDRLFLRSVYGSSRKQVLVRSRMPGIRTCWLNRALHWSSCATHELMPTVLLLFYVQKGNSSFTGAPVCFCSFLISLSGFIVPRAVVVNNLYRQLEQLDLRKVKIKWIINH